jgi:hypothetical protein
MLLLVMGLLGNALAAEKQDFDELLEAIYNQTEADVTYETLQERLWEYYNDPLALNEASRENLQLLCISHR